MSIELILPVSGVRLSERDGLVCVALHVDGKWREVLTAKKRNLKRTELMGSQLAVTAIGPRSNTDFC